jgi:hypothetical protein
MTLTSMLACPSARSGAPVLGSIRCRGSDPPGSGRYGERVTAQPVMTAEELFERMGHASPPTGDDVPVTFDGRRLDSAEAVRTWLGDLAARRAAAGADDSR